MERKSAVHRRRRAYVSVKDLPEAVKMVHEYVYDICLELGVCPTCQARVLHRTKKRTFAQCGLCLEYSREYQKERYERIER